MAGSFPDECRYVLEQIREVYGVEAKAKADGLGPQQRLSLHQEKSAPHMKNLEDYLREQLREKKVEPNSTLGEVFNYMLKRWERMTQFLRIPGAPLDNNTTERALKLAILNRKNAYFYRTLRGASVGDAMMSIIGTCWRNGVDPFDYFVALLQNLKHAVKNPEDWLPWNYRAAMVLLDQGSSRDPPEPERCESALSGDHHSPPHRQEPAITH